MFYFIEPQEHHFYQSNITQFIKDLQDAAIIGQPYDISQATFLLVTEDVEGISGGVLLLKQSINLLSPEIRKRLRERYPHLQDIWTGAILFQMDEALTGRAFEKACKALYRALYEDLIVFSIKENAPLLCLTMPLIEHLSIEVLGLWPCVLDIRSSSSNGLFHKVLQLPGTPQKPVHECKYNKAIEGSMPSSPVSPLFSTQNCNKNSTLYKKIKSFFRF